MNLDKMIANLIALRDANPGSGSLPVMYRHGASGDCGDLSSARITDESDECGPFDLDGASYVSIYAGN